MATGKEIRDRVFAMSGAILFFVTSIALTVVVILQIVQENHQKKDAAKALSSQTTCNQSPDAAAVAVPEIFKPEGDVTSLQSTDLKEGTGTAAKNGDCLVMKYYGTLASDGTVFDENYTKATGFGFTLGGGQVIKGWDQGLVGMKAGGERRLVIPADLAYGSQSPSSTIPANSALVFDVTLVKIQK